MASQSEWSRISALKANAELVWAAARMEQTPKLQKWRYGMLRNAVKRYLDFEPVVDIVRYFPS